MSLLMHLIAVEIAEKVAKEINIRNIFRRRPEDAMDVIRKAKDVLGAWSFLVNYSINTCVYVSESFSSKIDTEFWSNCMHMFAIIRKKQDMRSQPSQFLFFPFSLHSLTIGATRLVVPHVHDGAREDRGQRLQGPVGL